MIKNSKKHRAKLASNIRLGFAAALLGLIVSVVVGSLKFLTEHLEDHFFKFTPERGWLVLIFPCIGIALIRLFRRTLFKKRANKGIKEIYTTLNHRRNELPSYKIVSHYVNGFLTVIFGGSTGIEVSTVVSSAALGAEAHKRELVANSHKGALICAGVAAGVSALFCNPIAGLLFSMEVIARKVSSQLLLSTGISSIVAWLSVLLLPYHPLFRFRIDTWNYHALPWALALSVFAGLLAVYFTKLVIMTKQFYSSTSSGLYWIGGALLLGLMLLFFPQLYGDSYHSLPGMLKLVEHGDFSVNIVLILAAFIMVKPFAASLTLGIGGDGGVFAPSIVAGAVMGLLFAVIANRFFDAGLIVQNFMLLGAASMLSAAIFAPLTAVALICGLSGGAAILFVMLLPACYLSRFTARSVYRYNVYTYK